MIEISPSPTADTRTCDYAQVTKEQLLESSKQHIRDVQEAHQFFSRLIAQAMLAHDKDKLTDIDGFHFDFITGFRKDDWWQRHKRLNRHHLNDPNGVPEDVNLIDVLDYIADCVMAGMARSGTVYPLDLPMGVMNRAFQNTVALLKAQVKVVQHEPSR